MSVKGNTTYVSVEATDLSAYINTSSLTRGAGTENLTTYGKTAEVHGGTLINGRFTMGGLYAAGATGPRAILDPLVGTTCAIIRRTEGTGTGKPEQSFDGVLTSYVETNPVGGYITWSAEFVVSDDVTPTTQA